MNETALNILVESPYFKAGSYTLESVYRNLITESNLPDPEIGGEYLVAPVKEDNRWAAELSWGLEWPGVYKARSLEAKNKMSLAQRSLYVDRLEKLAEIKDLLLDYILCEQKLQLLEHLNQNNDSICRLSEQAAKGGELTVLDLNKVRLEYANIRVAKANLLDEKASLIGDISHIYGKNCSGLLQELELKFPAIEIPSEDIIAMISKNAPSVKTAQAEVELARQSLTVTKMQSLPSLSVGYKHAYEEGTHFNGALLGISIPIFSSRGRQKAAKAEIMEAEFKAEMEKASIETEMGQALNRLTLIKQQVGEIEPILKNSDHNALLIKAYKGGVITLLDYLAERNYFTTAEIEMLTLRHAAAKIQARLQKHLVTEVF